MADVSLLKDVNYPGKPCLLKMADKVLFFARNACGYENITYKKVENAKPYEEQYQVSQALRVKNAFARVLCAIVALALIIPTVVALAIKACLKGKQDKDIAKIHSLGDQRMQLSRPANTPLLNGPSARPSSTPNTSQRNGSSATTSSTSNTSQLNGSSSTPSSTSNTSQLNGSSTTPSSTSNTSQLNGANKPSALPPSSLTTAKPSDFQAPKSHLQKASMAIGNFANDLCLRITKNEGSKSYSISPVSIVAALGLCLYAIHPSKKELFLATIGLKGLSEDEAHKAIALTLRNMMIPKSFKEGTLNIAQGMAFMKKSIVSDSFIKMAQEIYGADLIHSQNLVVDVNKWVSEKTNEKIPEIIDQNYELVLLNALYLKLEWQHKFEKSHPWKVEQFTCLDGSQAPVSMMKQKGDFAIFKGQKFSLLEKPYKSPDGRSLSQVILLPNDPKDLPELEKDLTAEKLQSYRKAAEMKYDVTFSLPKTKAEFGTSLIKILKDMGMPFQLDPNVVDPSLYVSDVIHKTFVMTNEEGSEAAAATAVVMEKSCGKPVEFHVKHAYTYFIMDGDTVIFRGRVSDKGPLIVDK